MLATRPVEVVNPQDHRWHFHRSAAFGMTDSYCGYFESSSKNRNGSMSLNVILQGLAS